MKLFIMPKNTIKVALAAMMALPALAGYSQYDVEIKASTDVYITGGTVVAFKGANWVSASDVQGSGPVIFNATAAQNVNMNNRSLSGITVNNSNNITMLDSMTVANTTLFSQGNLLLGNFRITQSGKVEGQGNSGRFRANGNSIMVFNGSGGNDTLFLDQSTPNVTNRLKDLVLNRNGATLVCGDTAQIRGVVYHLAGTLDANDNRLKLKALSPTQYGQVAGIGTGTIEDTMYMEMQVGDGVQSSLEQWRHFTSPLKDATLSNELNDDITIFYSPATHWNVWNFDQTRLVNSWRPVTADETMHNKHYAIYLWPLSYGFQPSAASFMIDVNGTYPGTGDFSTTLGRNNPNGYTGQGYDDTVGWHMIANPYPSGISCKEQTDLEGGSSYYIWDITGTWDDSVGCGGCKKRGVYSMYRADNGLTANGGRSVIPPFHVFYVRAAIDNASFTVNNSWRTTDSMYNNIGRKTNDFDMLRIKVKSPEKVSDEAYIWFDQYRGDNKFDRLDAHKLMNDPYAPNIYTLTEDGKHTVFNVLKEITSDFYSVEMPFESKLDGTFEMDFEFTNPYQVQEIILEDRKTGTKTNILQNKKYNFAHESSTKLTDRFVLHFKKTHSNGVFEDYLSAKNPIEISTDSRSIYVRFPVIKDAGAEINVYDMLGRKVMETRKVTTDSELYIISGEGLSAGFYTVKVQSGKEFKSAPVFIGEN
ncbi:MAG: T9SS type A sorting domain-containing protein [Bacteroidota bacterium]